MTKRPKVPTKKIWHNMLIYGKLKNLGNGQGHGGYNRFDASAYHLSYT